MNYFLLFLTAGLVTAQQAITKQYNIKTRSRNVFIYTALVNLAAMMFFVVISGFKLDFNLSILPYSIGFAVANVSALAGMTIALGAGQLALTSLIISYSLIIPTLYGLIFLKDGATSFTYIGIVLLVISLYFLNAKKENEKISLKWLIFVSISFVGNGMCSVVQKIEQSTFDGAYKSEFMILALLIVCVSMFTVGMLGKCKDRWGAVCDALKYAPAKGLANGGVNFLVMVLTATIPNSILFPSISSFGIIFTYLLSKAVYKEEYSNKQKLGFVLGVISAIVLNI